MRNYPLDMWYYTYHNGTQNVSLTWPGDAQRRQFVGCKTGLCTAFSKGDFMKKPRVFSGAWLSLMVLGLAVVSCDSSSIDNKPNANNNPGTEANPIPLSANIWADGSITSSENTVWYTFNGTQGTTYYIWWNNSYQGNSTKTSDVYVSAVCNGSTIFQNVDSGRSNGRAFIANTTGTVKIKVTGSTGTFAIAYSTTSTRPISYTVIFHANSGSGTVPSAQAVEGGSSITLPSGSSLTKTGYTFGGWNTNTSGTGTTYGAGSSFTPTASITLYAKWDAPTQTISPDRIEYYWVDQHDSLATTSGGAIGIAPGGTLTITAQGTGYVARQWHLNGVNTGQSGNTYTFSSTTVGNHTVGLFVEKGGKLYNTNIIITVGTLNRTVTIDMYDSYGDGWASGGALRININGVQIANNVRVSSGSTNTYTFSVTTGDVVQVYWVAGSNQHENSFIVYYATTPPSPAFTASNNNTWNGSNALVYRLRNTMSNIGGGTLLGSFMVQ